MRVLLLSPVAELDPFNGDVVYTQELLANPPPGVEYVSYPAALDRGLIQERARWAVRTSSRPDAATVGQVAINRLRRRGVLFREPFRFFDVIPGAFDLVHCHVYSTRLNGLDCPLVLSNAAPLDWLYGDARKWSPAHVSWARAADTRLARWMDIDHIAYRMRRVRRLVCFTETLRSWYEQCDVIPPDRIDVVPCSVAVPEGSRAPRPRPKHVAFIGHYVAKGGDVAVAAFRRVRERHPDLTLSILGTDQAVPPGTTDDGVTWLGSVPREELLNRILPTVDVLIYPSRFDGLPLTLLEVMARGIPVLASDFGALPEILQYGGAGRVAPVDDVPAFAAGLEALLDPEANQRLGAAARARVEATYSHDVTRGQLRRAYDAALEETSVPVG